MSTDFNTILATLALILLALFWNAALLMLWL